MKRLTLLTILISLFSYSVFAEDKISVQTCSKTATEQVEKAKKDRESAPIVFKPIALGGEILTAAFGAGYVLVCGGADAVENVSRYSAREIKEAYDRSEEVTLRIKDRTFELAEDIKTNVKEKASEISKKTEEKSKEISRKTREKSVEAYIRLRLALELLFSSGR